jgi:hypothetical protein
MHLFLNRKAGFVLCCIGFLLFMILPVSVNAQSLPFPTDNIPFNALPPKDSNQITRITIDPVFIPHFNGESVQKGPIIHSGERFSPASMDMTFYLLCGLLFSLGVIYRSSPKYFNNLFGLLFQSGFRQKSIRDQLIQNKTTSLALNALFFITGGFFIYLFVQNFGLFSLQPWYVDGVICVSFLATLYSVKYLSVLTGGWIFGSRELAGQYVFIVFFVNKVAGLVLLPVIVVLWLGNPVLHPFFSTLSLIVIGFLFLYRYYMILPTVKSKSGISSFHFFLYLCTFEILPIVILVKFLANFLNSSN